MNTFFKSALSAIAIGGLVIFSSCKEDPELPDNLAAFETDQLGISPEESELEIVVRLSREVTEAGELVLSVEENGLVYGTTYTTDPVVEANLITIPVAAGSSQVSFTVSKVATVGYDGSESLVFAIVEVPEALVIGTQAQLTLSFGEILATAGQMEINGGGATYGNKVFIDLSRNRQTAIARTSWDLGFYAGDDFRVILNSSNGMLAYQLNKTDLTTVTNTDTAVLRNRLSMDAVFAALNNSPIPDWTAQSSSWIDDPAGDLTKTAIAEVSATAAENKVYIINRGNGVGSPTPALGWKKIRVIRNANGYTLQHADINATTFSEIQITKNNAFEFQFVSFSNGLMASEPERNSWDIAWTAFSNTTGRNPSAGDFTPVPYYFQDVVLQNRSGIQAVQILTSTKTYDAFAEADLTGLDFGIQTQIKIGISWRSGGGPGASPAVRTDRFYVIKDADGNYYKLKFTALTTNGERGRPQITYALIKRGV
ncbi:MAG: hypothetical protein J0L67_17705 [Cytophagales bacterium]|nr:hypothetical protein [Cytophagales bacterium]